MNFISYTLFSAALVGSIAIASAVPPSKQTWPDPSPRLRVEADYQQLSPGDRVALVCKECNTVSVDTIASKKHAMQYCVEGQAITCPSCKTVARVVTYGPPGRERAQVETKIVNQNGQECMFVSKLPK